MVIRNDTSEIALVREMLDDFGHAQGVEPQSLIQMQVVLDELVSNVIKYAWPQGGPHELGVHLSIAADDLQMEIVDDGDPFDPSGAPERARSAGVRPTPGGVGIQMVRKLVDRIEYSRVDGRNRTIITKRARKSALRHKE